MLSSQQLQTLKTAILADPTMSAFPSGPDGDFDLASYLNQTASPSYYVWQTHVTTMALRQALDWNLFISRSQGERDALTLMMNGSSLDFTLAAVRAGISNAFSGAGAQPQAARVAMFTAGSRLATRSEKIFATGTGTTPTEAGSGPAVMGYEGLVSASDVGAARTLP